VKRTTPRESAQARWSSPGAFILAATGFAIGLNTLWQLPQHLAQYGGGAFLLLYLVCLGVIGVPVMMAEVMIGRLGHGSPVRSVERLARRARVQGVWPVVGVLSVTNGFLLLAYISVVAGWLLAFALRAAAGTLDGLTVDGAGGVFSAFVREPERQLFWHSLFLAGVAVVAVREFHVRLEQMMLLAMGLLFISLLVLLGSASGSGGLSLAIERLLAPDFARLGWDGVVIAMGDAFVTLGLGVGSLVMFGSYLSEDAPIAQCSIAVAVLDTLAGLLAGLAFFAVLYSGGIEPLPDDTSGTAFVFQYLTAAFDRQPYGGTLLALGFLVLALAVWLRSLALIEPVLAWMQERLGFDRTTAVLWSTFLAWAIGVVCILSLQPWAFSFSFFGSVKTLGLFDVLQVFIGYVMVPAVAVLYAGFAGWKLGPRRTRVALQLRSGRLHLVWLWINRVVVPLWVLVLAYHIGLFL